MILSFRCKVDENCALLGYYAASSDNILSTFWDNLSFPSSGVKNPKQDGTDRFPKMSVRNDHYSMCNNPEEHSSQLTNFTN